MVDIELRDHILHVLSKICDADGWPVVIEVDGSRWVDRDWIVAELQKVLA